MRKGDPVWDYRAHNYVAYVYETRGPRGETHLVELEDRAARRVIWRAYAGGLYEAQRMAKQKAKYPPEGRRSLESGLADGSLTMEDLRGGSR